MTFGTPIEMGRDIGKTAEELGLKTENNWKVSQKTIDECEALDRQNAINWSKMKHMLVGQLYVPKQPKD